MSYIVIRDNKADKLLMCTEDILRTAGKLMQCLDELKREGEEMGERGGRYGNRGGYGSRSWNDENEMGERRGVPGSGYRW